MNYDTIALEEHLKYKGKLSTQIKVPLNTKEELSTFYSPGVAAPCLEIKKSPEKAYDYTWKSNTVAIISDGSAVLWLGNIWGLAGLPVMEGKAILFKKYANIDAIPIVLNTQDPEEIIKTIEYIAPNFWGINLEDIAAPQCFYIEEELKKRLNIPVFHDDQHGTAIVVLAGIKNALKIKQFELSSQKIVIAWAGAAAIAIGKLLRKAWATNIIFVDSKGILSPDRNDLNEYKQEVMYYNRLQISGSLFDAIRDADIFIWVGKGDLLKAEDILTMNNDPIIFALSNPTPEIRPEEAKKGWAFIVATWRSDFPNQVNNVLAFPGIFRGVLDRRISQITDEHKLIAAEALANYLPNPTVDEILPSALDKWVANAVAESIRGI